jgi:glucan biosynthesis protein C
LAALSLTMATWYFNLAPIGLALTRFSNPSPRTRYLADASYWSYIVHLPLVCVLQVWVADWNLHWSLKFPLILSIAFAVLLASYHYLVRYTSIGAVLNGRRYPRPSPLGASAAAPLLPP